MNEKVFLGGTCNGSQWREKLVPLLRIDSFNPVVDDWNEEAFKRENREKAEARWRLYCLTPKMLGSYAVAEVVDDSNKWPERTIMCLLEEDESETFEPHQLKALRKVGDMVAANGAKVFYSLQEVTDFLNDQG